MDYKLVKYFWKPTENIFFHKVNQSCISRADILINIKKTTTILLLLCWYGKQSCYNGEALCTPLVSPAQSFKKLSGFNAQVASSTPLLLGYKFEFSTSR